MSLALSLLPFNRLFAPAAGFISPAGPATTEAPSRACVRAPPLHSAYDHLGSTSLITNAHGRRLDRLQYSPWGVPLTGNFNRTRFGYTGHQRETATGSWYSLYRYLDPRAGKWTQRDPIGFAGGWNLYGYVGNSPLVRTDANGLTWRSNLSFLLDFLMGRGPRRRRYSFDTSAGPELNEIIDSPGAQRLRADFYAGECKTIDSFEYGTFSAFFETVLNPTYWPSTAAQVGGFMGSAVISWDGSVTFTITNAAGLRSFVLHQVPNLPAPTGSMSTIYQTFTWQERYLPEMSLPPGFISPSVGVPVVIPVERVVGNGP